MDCVLCKIEQLSQQLTSHCNFCSRRRMAQPSSIRAPRTLIEGSPVLARFVRKGGRPCCRDMYGLKAAMHPDYLIFGGYFSRDFLTMSSSLPSILTGSLFSSLAMARQTRERVLGRVAHLCGFCKVGGYASCNACRPPHDSRTPLIDPHRARFPISIAPKAAPRPLLRVPHQPSRHRIAMHIAQLLDALLFHPIH